MASPSRGWSYLELAEERRTPMAPAPSYPTPTEQAIRDVCRILSRAMWDADPRRTR